MTRDQQRSRRLRGDRGSALVEAAIILPFLVLMVFGIVELGFLFRSASVVNSSTRSGARLAAAQYASARNNSTNQANVISAVRQTVEKDLSARAGVDTPVDLWIYKADVDGTPFSSDFSKCTDPCYKFKWDTTTSPAQFTLKSGTWDKPVVCGTSHDSVGVFVRLNHNPIGFTNFLGTLTIAEHSVMVLEPPNPNDCPAGT
ncbi:MAG: TadE-like protein [Acidimicrobiaceae bacterium]|jgi:Flp pilus assembly protein TadG